MPEILSLHPAAATGSLLEATEVLHARALLHLCWMVIVTLLVLAAQLLCLLRMPWPLLS